MNSTRIPFGFDHVHGRCPYPERDDVHVNAFDLAITEAIGRVTSRFERSAVKLTQRAREVEAFERAMKGASDQELKHIAESLRPLLLRRGFDHGLVARCFALIREVSSRRVGQRHYPVQIVGGWALLQGMFAEMQTGEGKTLTAVLPAATAALAGIPVHIITVNDYLAARDANLLMPVYESLGLTVGVVQHGQNPSERRAAYACDVVYVVNKEIAFDYLRDRLLLGPRLSEAHAMVDRISGLASPQLLLRGLHFAIVDEADSVLVDESRTPLIISGVEKLQESGIFVTALSLARRLNADEDYAVLPAQHKTQLTPVGRTKLKEMTHGFDGVWVARSAREELVSQALAAQYLYNRDEHYVVVDGKVKIVDEFTGRIAEGRSWQHGLHQIIEAKEGCDITAPQQTQISITYQRFFQRYLRLAGMSGTLSEVAAELHAVYGLPTVRIPTNRPTKRTRLTTTFLRTTEQKSSAVIASVAKNRALGRPVLIGTRSVSSSQQLSNKLTEAGIEHVVLNAHHDRTEAEIVAKAGRLGQVTVATNMAGRGTDIQLGTGVAKIGGLHVILTEFHEASRIDRQLIGRGGRQGDPSTYEEIVSLEDELFSTYALSIAGLMRFRLSGSQEHASTLLGWLVRRYAQRAAERKHYKMRKETLRFQAKIDKALAFSHLR